VTGAAHLFKTKHVILVVILALWAWALWPPADQSNIVRLGSQSNAKKELPSHVKHVIRFNPGPLYLPGVIRENSTKPVAGILRVGEDFEKLYPDTRIEFVPGGAREWLVTQLSSGQAPDVIQVNVEEVWQDIQKNWYVPLDEYLEAPNPFVKDGEPGSKRWWDMFKYEDPTRGTMAPDGHMYCIVLDMIETGIFYNKDIFHRLGLNEPATWTEFLDIQKKIKDAGYIPMLVDQNALSDWGVDLTFDQVYGELRPLLDLDYDPRRGNYLKGYLDWDEIIFLHNKGFFQPTDPRWREVWRILKEWRPYMAKNLNNATNDMFKLFATQQGAMLWGHSMNVNRLVSDPDRKFDWGIFYLPPIQSSYSRFARGKEQCVIGGSAMQYNVTNSSYKDTGDPKTSERLKRVIAFLQFLTTPQNCDRVVNEQVALLPNIKGVKPHEVLEPFDRFLQRHYSMTKWVFTFDNQFNEVMVRMLDLYLNGGIDQAEFMRLLELDMDRTSRQIVQRKKLDLSRFEKTWQERRGMAAQFKELPPEPPR
jgi:ABC-type glycerol-3-phosphate transport system substrate-binding protein